LHKGALPGTPNNSNYPPVNWHRYGTRFIGKSSSKGKPWISNINVTLPEGKCQVPSIFHAWNLENNGEPRELLPFFVVGLGFQVGMNCFKSHLHKHESDFSV
jgi:hypothetical protein